MPTAAYTRRTTWHPDPESLCDGHLVHTRNPIPRAWEQAPAEATTHLLTDYTPAQQAAALAYHEAGHAIVWDLCGVTVDRIALGEVEGLAASTSPREDEYPLESVLVGLAAGYVAEARFLAEAGLYTPERAWATERHAATDQRHADRLCREHLGHPLRYGDGDGVSDWEQASKSADLMVSVRWGNLVRLAEELIWSWEEGDHVMPARVISQFTDTLG
ncbi:hypothetical protein [Nocardiopsis alba]|uniref:hypothetical protein n=1 Tax=Nocardiopsis alba TaxID=53437 RepID=UPI0033A253B6